MHTLFTAGYQGLNIEAFRELLLAHGVAHVIDIRERPYSRKPDFSKKRLTAHLAAEGIAYTHIVELGTAKPIRDEVRRSRDYPAFFARIEPLFAAQPEALDRALALIRAEQCCLLCYEGPATECHRLTVARLLAERGGDVAVVHL